MADESIRSQPSASTAAASDVNESLVASEQAVQAPDGRPINLQSDDAVSDDFDFDINIDEVECTDEEVMKAFENMEEVLEKAAARRTRFVELLATRYPHRFRGRNLQSI